MFWIFYFNKNSYFSDFFKKSKVVTYVGIAKSGHILGDTLLELLEELFRELWH